MTRHPRFNQSSETGHSHTDTDAKSDAESGAVSTSDDHDGSLSNESASDTDTPGERSANGTNNASNKNVSERRRGIYILPHLFTTAGLLAAFYAMVQGIQGDFAMAAIGILVATIMDGLDGRIARWTNTASEFGKEYDSLVDVIAFGMAPALVVALWTLKSAGKMGWLVAFLYVTATALRLARFNTHEVEDKRYFSGLPCPSAAALVATSVWWMSDYAVAQSITTSVMFVLTFLLAVCMVSPVPYRSFKEFDPKGRVSLTTAFLVALALVIVSFEPHLILFSGFLAYFLSGPVAKLLSYLRKRRRAGTA